MLTAYLLMQALAAPPGIDASPVLERVSRLRIPAAEIVAFDAATDRAFVTSTDGVVIVKLADGRGAEIVARVDAAKAAGIALGEISHVRVDPRGRGVAACTVIPPRHAEEPGKVLFFESTTGATLAAVDVGFNPDCCEFSADGAFLVVANEGEPEAGTKPDDPMHDPPGSVSRIALDDLAAPADFAKLTNDRVRTVSIPRALIAAAKPPLRIHPSLRRTPELDVEPEFIALDGHTAMVSLQENDAIGAFDCDRSEWVALHGLGTIERTIDASDKDGGAKIDDAVAGLPMPDHVAIVEVTGDAAP